MKNVQSIGLGVIGGILALIGGVIKYAYTTGKLRLPKSRQL